MSKEKFQGFLDAAYAKDAATQVAKATVPAGEFRSGDVYKNKDEDRTGITAFELERRQKIMARLRLVGDYTQAVFGDMHDRGVEPREGLFTFSGGINQARGLRRRIAQRRMPEPDMPRGWLVHIGSGLGHRHGVVDHSAIVLDTEGAARVTGLQVAGTAPVKGANIDNVSIAATRPMDTMRPYSAYGGDRPNLFESPYAVLHNYNSYWADQNRIVDKIQARVGQIAVAHGVRL